MDTVSLIFNGFIVWFFVSYITCMVSLAALLKFQPPPPPPPPHPPSPLPPSKKKIPSPQDAGREEGKADTPPNE